MALTNSYLKSVYETVEKRNPNEPEFQFTKSSRAWSRS